MQITKKAGFTLIEMVIVMAIIAGLMAMIIPVVMKKWGQADIQKYRMQLGRVKEGLIDYKIATGNFPSEQEGIGILADPVKYKKISSGADAPLKAEEILDQNGTPIIYHRATNIKNKDKYRTFELLWIGTGESEENPQLSDGQ